MIPVFVISLKDETARREAIAAHLKERGLDFEFFDATDGRQMDVLAYPAYNKAKRRAAHGRDLKPGELGCMLSHRGIYQKLVDDGLDYALVLEDDARLHEDTKATLEALIEGGTDFDIVRLLGSPKVARGKHRKIAKLFTPSQPSPHGGEGEGGEPFWLVRLRTAPGGAHATLISQKGARKLLAATESFAFPIDTIMGRGWETGITAYSIQPGLAVQDLSFDSAIGDERHDKTIHLKGLEKLKYKITRPLFKLSEAIGKGWVYWGGAPKDLAVKKKFG